MCCNGPVIFLKIDPDHKRLTSKEEIRWILSDEKKLTRILTKHHKIFIFYELLWILVEIWLWIHFTIYHTVISKYVKIFKI